MPGVAWKGLFQMAQKLYGIDQIIPMLCVRSRLGNVVLDTPKRVRFVATGPNLDAGVLVPEIVG
jgi:hypothetical protein